MVGWDGVESSDAVDNPKPNANPPPPTPIHPNTQVCHAKLADLQLGEAALTRLEEQQIQLSDLTGVLRHMGR